MARSDSTVISTRARGTGESTAHRIGLQLLLALEPPPIVAEPPRAGVIGHYENRSGDQTALSVAS
jgi:hypothetical protein